MTALLEKIVAIIAPHRCFLCSEEDNIVCFGCQNQVFLPPDSACVLCGVPTIDWQTCEACRKSSKMEHLVPATMYEGVAQKVLHSFKFERMRAAAEPLARALDDTLPYFGPEVLVVPLPTAPRHVRQRGYDQTLLLAQQFASLRGLKVARPLLRSHNLRQVGQSREERFKQAAAAYELKPRQALAGKRILLIDDICTTGASLSAAAKVLHAAGASEISAGVVAWQDKER